MWDRSLLAGVLARADLIGLARKRHRLVDRTTVKLTDLDQAVADGWVLRIRRKRTAAVERPKRHDVLLEDRVWSLLYRMGFEWLSDSGGAVLTVNPSADRVVTSQIDVVGLDDEVCIAIECKSMQRRGRRQNLQQEIAKHALTRESLGRAANPTGSTTKRTIVHGLWTFNALLSKNDRARAEEHGVALLDSDDLEYYETLTKHLGPAAKYQFLADLTPGRRIPGLSLRVPALEGRMGGYRCFTFAASPDYLMKIAYVSHRARGKGSDIATYQRMVNKTRLRKIARYIAEPDGIFPTNLVLNFDPGRRGAGLRFDRVKQEGGQEAATYGWLTLRPTYKSAWIIDGQHRLYAYSGHPRAAASTLVVLAFEGLPGSVQQKLFIDINAEQKSVKKSLLQELYADLHRDSDDPQKRTQALISEAIQQLDSDPDSPFSGRVLLADDRRTDTRCISMNSLFSALDKPGLYYGSLKGGVVVAPGPLWAADDDEIIQRTTSALTAWFGTIRDHVRDWWDLGAADGGGLAMNDGVTVCLLVLRSVVEHLDAKKSVLHTHSIRELNERLAPFAQSLGKHFESMEPDNRKAFRALRGVQGQTAGMRHAQQDLQQAFPEFRPEGLQEYLEREKAGTNDRAASLINEIERILQRMVISILREQFGVEGDRWWYEGVPPPVRRPATARQDEDMNRRGSREAYLDLIDYRIIAVARWQLFGTLLGYGRTGNKQVKTEWIRRVNEIRQVAMHGSSGTYVSFEEISELTTYRDWLASQATGSTSEDVVLAEAIEGSGEVDSDESA